MMTQRRLHYIIALITLLVTGLGISNWYFNPEKVIGWSIGIGFMLLGWVIVALILSKRPLSTFGKDERRYFSASIIAAGLIIATAMGLKLLANLTTLDLSLVERFWGVTMGAVLIVMGNMMPKILSPLTHQHCAHRKAQSVQRFAGWSFVLAGLAYAAAWLVLPEQQAGTVATLICLFSVILVILRCAWAFKAPSKLPPPSSRG